MDSDKKDRDRIMEKGDENLIIRPAFDLLLRFLKRNPENVSRVIDFLKKSISEKELALFLGSVPLTESGPLKIIFEAFFPALLQNREARKLRDVSENKTYRALQEMEPYEYLALDNEFYLNNMEYSNSLKYLSVLWNESFKNGSYWDCLYFSRQMINLPIYIQK